MTTDNLEKLTHDEIRKKIEDHNIELDGLYKELANREEKLINEAQSRFQRARDELQKVYAETNHHGSHMRNIIGILNNNY